MTRRTVPAQDAALGRLADDVQRFGRDLARLADLPSLVATHARLLTELTESVAQLRRRAGAGDGTEVDHRDPGPSVAREADADNEEQADVEPTAAAPAWLTVTDPAQAIAWLNELTLWVPSVWQPHLQTKTPGCWPWHPPVVAELLVVKQLWDEAVLDDAGPAPLAAWHDRWRPAASGRLFKLMAGCERSEGLHKVSLDTYIYDLSYLDEVGEWWATTHGMQRQRPAPGLVRADPHTGRPL